MIDPRWEPAAREIVRILPEVHEQWVREGVREMADRTADLVADEEALVRDLLAEGPPELSFEHLIADAGARVLGISELDADRHPAVVAACRMLGRPARVDRYAEKYGRDHHMARVEVPRVEVPIGLPGPDRLTPTGPPEILLGNVRLAQGEEDVPCLYFERVTHLGGHPQLRQRQATLTLLFGRCSIAVYDKRADCVAELEWAKLQSLQVEGPDIPESRVTIPRVAAGGLFAWAFKKEKRRAFLCCGGAFGEVVFEIPGLTGLELRAGISPVSRWPASANGAPGAGAG